MTEGTTAPTRPADGRAAPPTDPPSPPRPPRHPGHAEPLGHGDKVLLIDRKGRRYLVTLRDGGEFHFHGGRVGHDDLLGRPEGCRVRSSRGRVLLAVRPTAADWTVKAPRGAQVVYPKDQAMIVALGDVGPGMRVIEAGAGSGALTAALLRAVGPAGSVVSFEVREDHAAVAARNVADRFGGHPPTWDLRVEDVVAGLDAVRTSPDAADASCDRVVLDLADPAAVLPAAARVLRPGGVLVAYTPTVPQVMRLHEGLADARVPGRTWGLAQTVETLLRPWHVDGLSVRPDHRMVAHTAFLTSARLLAEDPAGPDADPAGPGEDPGAHGPDDAAAP